MWEDDRRQDSGCVFKFERDLKGGDPPIESLLAGPQWPVHSGKISKIPKVSHVALVLIAAPSLPPHVSPTPPIILR